MNRLRLLRFERGLSQGDVSAAAGVSQQTLSALEHGHREPSAETAKALADFYEVPVAEILGLEQVA